MVKTGVVRSSPTSYRFRGPILNCSLACSHAVSARRKELPPRVLLRRLTTAAAITEVNPARLTNEWYVAQRSFYVGLYHYLRRYRAHRGAVWIDWCGRA